MAYEHSNLLLNIDCLDLLERVPSNAIDLTYIDPPWAVTDTGNWAPTIEFGTSTIKESTRKSELLQSLNMYLDFLEIRLRHVHRTLKETGSIFIHTGPGNSHDIQALLETIFGVDNYIAEYVLPGQSFANTRPRHSLLIVYGKTRKAVHHQLRRPLSETEFGDSYKRDEAGRPYRLTSLIRPDDDRRAASRYEWKGALPPNNGRWLYRQEKMEELDEQGLIDYSGTSGLPRLKQYLDDIQVPIGSVWDDLSSRMERDESTGFVTQQSLSLLERIIQLGTSDGDTIIDPFCGSGTCLVAAHKLGRKWIGCDLSPEAYAISLERLEDTLKLEVNRDFIHGDGAVAEQVFPDTSEPSPLNSTSLWIRRRDAAGDPRLTPVEYVTGPEDIRPMIFTEGKTDWKHLQTAYNQLRKNGLVRNDLRLEFYRQEDVVGEQKLLDMLEADARRSQPRLNVYVFDRDNDKIVKNVTVGDGSDYKWWNKNVYSLALPVPEHRTKTPAVCIELYYKDEDLLRPDEDGRRIFLSAEFDPKSARHISDPRYSTLEHSKLQSPALRIIDQKVFDNDYQSVALSKDAFAEYILNGADGFNDVDMSAFVAVFDLIGRIVDDARSQ